MLSEPRAILFHTELQLPPIEEIKVSKERVRELYNKMCEPGGYTYENLDLQATIPTLSTRKPDGNRFVAWVATGSSSKNGIPRFMK